MEHGDLIVELLAAYRTVSAAARHLAPWWGDGAAAEAVAKPAASSGSRAPGGRRHRRLRQQLERLRFNADPALESRS
jgi:hypothetical protein